MTTTIQAATQAPSDAQTCVHPSDKSQNPAWKFEQVLAEGEEEFSKAELSAPGPNPRAHQPGRKGTGPTRPGPSKTTGKDQPAAAGDPVSSPVVPPAAITPPAAAFDPSSFLVPSIVMPVPVELAAPPADLVANEVPQASAPRTVAAPTILDRSVAATPFTTGTPAPTRAQAPTPTVTAAGVPSDLEAVPTVIATPERATQPVEATPEARVSPAPVPAEIDAEIATEIAPPTNVRTAAVEVAHDILGDDILAETATQAPALAQATPATKPATEARTDRKRSVEVKAVATGSAAAGNEALESDPAPAATQVAGDAAEHPRATTSRAVKAVAQSNDGAEVAGATPELATPDEIRPKTDPTAVASASSVGIPAESAAKEAAPLEPATERVKAAPVGSVRPAGTEHPPVLHEAGATAKAENADEIARIATPTRFERVLEQLRGEIHKGRDEFRLTLEPAELGRLDVNIAARGDGVILKIVAEKSEVAHWLRTDLPLLQKSIEKDGLHVLGIELRSSLDQHSHTREQGKHHAFDFADVDGPSHHALKRSPLALGRPTHSNPTSTTRLDLLV